MAQTRAGEKKSGPRAIGAGVNIVPQILHLRLRKQPLVMADDFTMKNLVAVGRYAPL